MSAVARIICENIHKSPDLLHSFYGGVKGHGKQNHSGYRRLRYEASPMLIRVSFVYYATCIMKGTKELTLGAAQGVSYTHAIDIDMRGTIIRIMRMRTAN